MTDRLLNDYICLGWGGGRGRWQWVLWGRRRRARDPRQRASAGSSLKLLHPHHVPWHGAQGDKNISVDSGSDLVISLFLLKANWRRPLKSHMCKPLAGGILFYSQKNQTDKRYRIQKSEQYGLPLVVKNTFTYPQILKRMFLLYFGHLLLFLFFVSPSSFPLGKSK